MSPVALSVAWSVSFAGLALLSACSSNTAVASKHSRSPESTSAPDALYLGLATPTDGFQLRTIGVDIGPGEEREYCEVGVIPGAPTDSYYVSLLELANGVSSHHLALSVATPGSEAAVKLEALGVGNYQECLGATLEFGDGIEGLVTIQTPRGDDELPAGVARKFHGGQFVVFDYHYANTSDEAMHTQSAVNFHTIDAATVEHVAQTFGINNLLVDVPPGQTASFTGECHFTADAAVAGFIRHTHRWGMDFSVWQAGGADDGKEFWTSHDRDSETQFRFPEPATLHAGEGFRYRCTYVNDTNRRVRFGTTVNDEMCMLYGAAWPVNDGEQIGMRWCDIMWVDQGGIGHPVNEAGGIPKSDPSDVALCMSSFGASADPCAQCACNSCATPALRCVGDADCQPLLLCFAGCSDAACARNCQGLVREHSSGTGPLVVLEECVNAGCSAECATSPINVGAGSVP